MRTTTVLLLLACGCVVTARQVGKGARLSGDGRGSEPMKPSMVPSDEATADQLQLAQDQGKEVGRAVAALAGAVSASGRAFAGEYELVWFAGAPRGTWEPSAGTLSWKEPQGTAFLGVVVRDGGDGRGVPGVRVRAALLRDGGAAAWEGELRYRWDAALDLYGANVTAPPGRYTLRVDVEPPPYDRHDPLNGDRFEDAATATFADATLPGSPGPGLDDTRSLALGRAQGEALLRAYEEMANATANDGSLQPLGDYRVSCAVEFAETYWRMEDGKLSYFMRPEESGEWNAHLEIAVLDAATGRFLPDLKVRAALETASGASAGEDDVRFMWHPWLYHYGRNWRVPGAGRYRVRVHVDPPPWPRDGERLGKRFAQAADFVCPELKIETGQK